MNISKGMVIGLACMSAPVAAQNAFFVEEVSDAELAQLRGRFVLPDRVVHFGVTMTTLWQNGAGNLGAQVQFQVNAGSQPSLHVSLLDEASGGAPIAHGAGQVIGGAGLGEVRGVVQSARSAGDYNDTLNTISVRINQSSDLPPLAGQSWAGPMALSNDVGSIQVSREMGGLQISVQASHGQGNAKHLIGGGLLAQQSNISGSMNKVINTAELNVTLRQMALGADLARCAWEQLRGLKPAGI